MTSQTVHFPEIFIKLSRRHQFLSSSFNRKTCPHCRQRWNWDNNFITWYHIKYIYFVVCTVVDTFSFSKNYIKKWTIFYHILPNLRNMPKCWNHNYVLKQDKRVQAGSLYIHTCSKWYMCILKDLNNFWFLGNFSKKLVYSLAEV